MSRSDRAPAGAGDPCSQLDDLEQCAASLEGSEHCSVGCQCNEIIRRVHDLLQDVPALPSESADGDSVAHSCMLLEKAQAILPAIACNLLRLNHRATAVQAVLDCFKR